MKREDYPIYQTGIQFYLACENQSFSRIIENSALGHVERGLLLARKNFSLNQFHVAIKLLNDLTPESSFLLGEKYLLLATAHSNLGDREEAFLFNTRAIEAYKGCSDQRGLFLSTYNLSVDAGLLGLKKISLDNFDKARSLAVKVEEKLLIMRAHACALSAERKYGKALTEIKIALDLCEKEASTNKLDVLTLKVVSSDIYFRNGFIDEAIQQLEDIRHEKLLKPKARVFFNLSLLHFLKSGKLETKPKRVAESLEYSLKWDIISTLLTGDLSGAQKQWAQLQTQFPNSYGSDFSAQTYYDEESIFFCGLRSIQKKASLRPEVEFMTGSKLAILHSCLTDAKSPLRKEELIERIWGIPYDPSFDTRFYKLIQRLKDSSLPIANEKRAYFYKSS